MADENIERLKKRRTKYRTSITKIIKDIESALLESEVKVDELEELLEHLSVNSTELKDIDSELENILDLKDLDKELKSNAEYQEKITTWRFRASKKISAKKHSESSSQISNSNNSTQKSDIKEISSVKLPDIPLPIFSGKFEEYNLFISQFKSLIDDNKKLSDTQKLYYLQACLNGDAKNIETVDDTYSSLLSALKDRFDNKRAIVDSHINCIINYNKIVHDSANHIRNFLDCINKNLRALKGLKFDRNNFTDILLVNIIIQKLNRETRQQYELSLKTKDVPSLTDLLTFLEQRALVLESVNRNLNTQASQKTSIGQHNKSRSLIVNSKEPKKICILCKETHSLNKCAQFQNMDIDKRFEFVRNNKLCYNCLNGQHRISNCISKHLCNICHQRHNSLLHRSNVRVPTNNSAPTSVSVGHTLNPHAETFTSEQELAASTSMSCFDTRNKSVILSTAVVWVFSPGTGTFIRARALLDSGSMSSIMTTDFAKRLGIPFERISFSVSSLGGKETVIKSKIQAMIQNGNGSYSATLNFLIVPKITDSLPTASLSITNMKIPDQLADPNFAVPNKIDLLIGAELFYDLVKNDTIKVSDSLVFRKSVFGYIATGTVESSSQSPYCGLVSHIQNIDESLQKFWQLESIDETDKILSEEELYCEIHYQRTHKRNKEGRYVVQMPTKDIKELGDSKQLAEKRLNQLLKRLSNDNEMQKLYEEFMEEYLQLDHMERIRASYENNSENPCYYLPHHGVYRPEKLSTKLRVVFNASANTTSGKSLNDILMKGEVKEDIFDIMVRFRKHKYAFTTDIQKMFRQILVDPDQCDLLRILWKPANEDHPVTYRLKTVTYGTTCAPFLAIRTVKQLALDEEAKFPLASQVAQQDIYMDDIVTGTADFETAKTLQSQLKHMLDAGGMKLHKWNSNSEELMNSFQEQGHFFSTNLDSSVKTLGIYWNPAEDQFLFQVKIPEKLVYAKRDVLSVIARIYDPIGLLGPVISKAKIFLQKLWIEKLDWNDVLPPSIANEWADFVLSLKYLENMKVDRFILADTYQRTILKGFCDASQAAYGAVIYMECTTPNGNTTKLIASKSRVAPIKIISIPRLELCACLLLSQLVNKVHQSLKMNIDEIILHSDSTIAIAWINTSPHKLKVFIGNRVAKIQKLTEGLQWKHVASDQNPADVISRGASPQELSSMTLWWNGPSPNALEHSVDRDDGKIDISSSDVFRTEFKKTDINLPILSKNSLLKRLFTVTNNYMKLIRIISYVFRFLENSKAKIRQVGPLSKEELQRSKIWLVREVQASSFSNELKLLEKGKNIKASQLSCLTPFQDKQGVIRVGGRLVNSSLSMDKKFPILLPKNHDLTLMIMTYFHLKYLHVGAQTLLYLVREEFWPLGGRNTARSIIHNCITCFKNKPKTVQQIMGNLPRERITPASPFTHVGIDFCGYFFIKYKGQRKGTYNKIYVAIFICFVTKAIHFEVVTDLTTDAMIAALKRFCSRRGKPSTICTDNATNFKGASSELKRLYNLIKNPNEDVINYLSNEEIAWKFIPPNSPNFGGLWEAGVKSFKYHLKRAVGNSHLTLEQFLTVTAQIEAILNSRPLTPLSSDPNDFAVLTPGHFLIGRPLTSIAEQDVTAKPDNYLSQWKLLSKFVQNIWKKWKLDYLNNLQARNKWQFAKENVKPNAMVLLKDDHSPPCQWTVGRIQEIIKGSDDKVRVAIVKTPNGTFKRAISKLCLLPMENN